jgi:hypothetical protein
MTLKWCYYHYTFHRHFLIIIVYTTYTYFWTICNHVISISKIHILETYLHEDNCHFLLREDDFVFYLTFNFEKKTWDWSDSMIIIKHSAYVLKSLCPLLWYCVTLSIMMIIGYSNAYITYGVQSFAQWNAISSCKVQKFACWRLWC